MILYRALQPLLHSTFGALAFILKHTPGLKDKTEKLWTTWDIRQIDGLPAFRKIDPRIFNGQKPIWIHAASGEFEYAKPVIRELQLKRPGTPILVTYFSPTYAENVRKFPGVTASCPLPLDSRDELDEFQLHLNPAALLIARTDAWPNTVRAAHERGLPILLFSTTFHERSKRMSGLGRKLTFDTLKQIDLIQCVSKDDQATLKTLGLENVEVSGDTRYDQVLARLSSPRPPTTVAMMAALKETIRERSQVAGSVWSEDLEPVITASSATQAKNPHTLILVPHEISESFLKEIEAKCLAHGFRKEKIARMSRLNSSNQPLDVVIVDGVGLLAELYLLSEIAFVGGSFRKTVHSVMEPLAAGCLTLVGPLHTNNREAIEFQMLKASDSGPSFVTAVQDAAEMTKALSRLWNESQNLKSKIQAEVARRGGATASVVRWLSGLNL